MKLTDRQRIIAGYFQLQADVPSAIAAKALGIREHTVRRELDALVRRGVLVPYPLIDSYRLGYLEHDLFFSLGGQPKRESAQFVRYLSSAPGISWVIEVGGPYQLGITVLARSALEAHGVLRGVSDRFPGMLTGRDLSLTVHWTLFRRRYLREELPAPKGISVAQAPEIEVLDAVDRKILRQLSQERLRRQRDVARGIGVPESTVSYHLARLRERQIFRGFVFSVESSLFGVTPFRIHLWMRDFSSRGHQLVRRFAESHPNVVSLTERLGSPDFSMRVEVEDSDVVFSMGQELRDALGPELAKVEILPIFHERKISPYPFLT